MYATLVFREFGAYTSDLWVRRLAAFWTGRSEQCVVNNSYSAFLAARSGQRDLGRAFSAARSRSPRRFLNSGF